MAGVHSRSFSVVDIVIFVAMLLVSICIGLLFAFRNRHTNDTRNYFLGNQKLRPLPVALSFVVTFQSSILILGFPAETYAYGMQYSLNIVGIIVSYSLAAWLVVPIYHPLKVTSAYHYYQLRYGENSVRYVAVFCGMAYYLLYMGFVLYGTALALQSVADVPLWLTIVVFTTATVFYTSIGGIQAVIWTDVFQCAVMVFGISAVLISSTIRAGGTAKVFELSRERFNFFDFNPDPTVRHTFWTLSIGSITQFFYLTISQAGVQRINSTPTIKVAKTVMLISGPTYSFIWVLSMFQGVTLFAYFSSKGCDPLASGAFDNINQLIPYSMMELFHNTPGLPGLVISGLAAAALSTISSGLSSLAAITYEDIIKQLKPNIRDTTATSISKVSVVVFGIIAAGIAFLIMNVKGPIGQMFASFVSSLDGTQVGLYLTSIFFRRARPKAMVCALLLGVAVVMWIGSGQNILASIPRPPYLPLGPTANCSISQHVTNDTGAFSNASYDEFLHNTSIALTKLGTSSTPAMPETKQGRTVLQTFYSISYMYLNLIGTVIVVVCGIVFSLLTQPKVPTKVNENLMISISDILPCFGKTCSARDNEKKGAKHEDAKADEELQAMTCNDACAHTT